MANLLSDTFNSRRNTEMILAGEFTPEMQEGNGASSEGANVNNQDSSMDPMQPEPTNSIGNRYKNLHD